MITYQHPDSCVVQFAKTPIRGRVKTRLQKVLQEDGCLLLHKALLEHQLETIKFASVAPQSLWYCGTEVDSEIEDIGGGTGYFQNLIEGSDITLGIQQGESLGDRMAHCFVELHQYYEYVILIGSDCPAINGQYINEAIMALKDGDDAVFGPANDGGYVLVGFRRLDTAQIKPIFTDVPWGTDKVMSTTRLKLAASKLKWAELSVKQDIDRPEDLPSLAGFSGLAEFAIK